MVDPNTQIEQEVSKVKLKPSRQYTKLSLDFRAYFSISHNGEGLIIFIPAKRKKERKQSERSMNVRAQ